MTLTVNGPITIDQFRRDFPVFADSSKYEDEQIALYLNVFGPSINAQRWGQFYTLGIELLVAHNMALDALAARQGAGGVPGIGNTGIVASKSVGSASISYDTSLGIDPRAGDYNLTIYGRRLYRIIRMVGMAPTQVGGQNEDMAAGTVIVT